MSRKRCTPKKIIGVLREAEVRLSQGENVGAIAVGFAYRFNKRRHAAGKHDVECRWIDGAFVKP